MKYSLLIGIGILNTVLNGTANACTGITLKARDNSIVVARTMDWSREEVDNMYVIVPREHVMKSLLPDGTNDGLAFTSRFGFAGFAVEQPEFIIDGTNEAGLSAALFYFPAYGDYVEYDPEYRDTSLADFQVVPWILSRFSTIDQVKEAIKDVRIINVDPRMETVHWRIMEPSGRQVVLEIVNGVPNFYDNEIGVLTNAPGFEWMTTNLNNYVNLKPGTAGPTSMKTPTGEMTLRAFGSGSGLRGLPGDMTPPSRFVRAAFFQSYTLARDTGYQAVLQAFHLLNSFDVPAGIQFPVGQSPNDMAAATQWTAATDLTHRIIYYHTMYNRTVRAIEMDKIDFANVKFQSHRLDETKSETVIPGRID